MRAIVGFFAAALSLALVTPAALIASSALAQAQQSAPADEGAKQVALTDQQVQNFLAAQKDIDAILQKVPQGAQGPDPTAMAALDAAAKTYNFANYAEYDTVASNIGLVMAGMDPQTKKYVGPEAVIKEQIAEIQADKSMSPKDKKDQLDELNAQLQSPQPAALPGNIDLVSKYYDKLAASAPQND
jgi:hypothetical protein